MLENLAVFIFVSLIVAKSDKKRAIGLLVFSYYTVYMLLDLDQFSSMIGNVFTTYQDFVQWYLICAAVGFLFFIASLIIYMTKDSRTALIYSIWLLFNVAISGISAVFQSFETNAFLIVYNVVQNINLIIDLLVVVIGTDNPIRSARRVSIVVNRIGTMFDNYWLFNAPKRDKGKACQQAI
jgi:hypothetical protein